MDYLEVYRGDVKAVRRLGEAFLRTCRVGLWEQTPAGFWKPGSWWVPAEVLREKDLTPLAKNDADAIRAHISEGVESAWGRKRKAQQEERRARAAIRRKFKLDHR